MRKIVAFLIFILLAASTAFADLSVTFLDVGHGDCALVICDGETMMIDTGPAGAWNNIEPKLSGISNLKYLVLTHPHADHIGNAVNIIESIPVDAAILPPIRHDSKTYGKTMTAINKEEIKQIYPFVGDTYRLGGATITVYAPYPVAYTETNDYSVVLMLEYSGTKILFCGDAEGESEHDMLAGDLPLEADILKVGHHGSDTSSTHDFVSAVSPAYAIISCGERGDYPSADVGLTLSEAGAEILVTKTMGDITFLLRPAP